MIARMPSEAGLTTPVLLSLLEMLTLGINGASRTKRDAADEGRRQAKLWIEGRAD
jgi:hypothetical protein